MRPTVLRTRRVVLDQPAVDDVDDIARYCTDPVFEHWMTTPWPYRREHAVGFVTDHVPGGWAEDREYTWALRGKDRGPLMGVLGIRVDPAGSCNLGYWLGAEHRGHGVMSEAVSAAADWAFSRRITDLLRWEAVVGNAASLSVARRAGFRYIGVSPADIVSRDGARPASWRAELRRTDDRAPKPGWPV